MARVADFNDKILNQSIMCEFQQLFLSKEGYIVLCRHCGCFQLCYGKMVLDLSKHDFEVLQDREQPF